MYKRLPSYSFYAISFCLPAILMFVVLLCNGIYWGSERTILASDGFHQYAIFAQGLRDVLHGQEHLFYTFKSGLGLNFYALISYYLGSPLTPLLYFFNQTNMPDAIYLLTLLKFGCIGLSMAYCLRHLHPKLHSCLTLALSTSFALLSFSVSQLELNNWLDVFIMLPLVILGLHRLMTQKRLVLYYTSLSLLFIQNYYFGYMTAIFLALYFLVCLTEVPSWKQRFSTFRDFTITSLLAGMTSLIMTLPAYLDLSTHGESFSHISQLLSEKAGAFDLFAKHMVGAYDTTKFGSLPTIYGGLLSFLAMTAFISLKTIPLKSRVAHCLLIIFIIISFYLQPLDLFWQGMHAPNMFLHRYAWVLPLLSTLMAARAFSDFQHIRPWQWGGSFIVITLGFLITYHFKAQYSFIQPIHICLTLAFLLAYLISTLSSHSKEIPFSMTACCLLFFAVAESGLNAHYQILGIQNDWGFPSREGYLENTAEYQAILAKMNQENPEFFRTEQLFPKTGNDGMKYRYNAISQFSSIRNRRSSHVLDKLGFHSTGTNLNLRYHNNSIIADSIFGIAANLSPVNVDKYGFSSSIPEQKTVLAKNSNALGLAILTEKPYQDFPLTVNTLDNQTAFLNQLSGLKERYFYNIEPLSPATAINLQVKEGEVPQISYQLNIPRNYQLYISLSNLTLSNEDTDIIKATINNHTTDYSLDNAYPFLNLGYYSEDTPLEVTLSFPNNHTVFANKPHFYALDTLAYQKAIDKLKSKSVQTIVSGNTVTTTYDSQNKTSLLYTIPYDKGWTAKQDGKSIAIQKAQDGFMKVDVKKGKGKVILTFIPQGFYTGLLLSTFALFLFWSYATYHHKRVGQL